MARLKVHSGRSVLEPAGGPSSYGSSGVVPDQHLRLVPDVVAGIGQPPHRDRHPRPAAATRRTGAARRPRAGPRGWPTGRSPAGPTGGPGPDADPCPAPTRPVRSRDSSEASSASGTTRGAITATRGSSKNGTSRSSQPGSGRQSESTNATRAERARARPALRAAAGPRFTGSRRYRAPAAAAMSPSGLGSSVASSTTRTSSPARLRRHRASPSGRRYAGTTTVTSWGPWRGSGRGCRMPRSTRVSPARRSICPMWTIPAGWPRPLWTMPPR